VTFDSNDLATRLRALTSGKSPARWLVAFSGGVDSTVLLHALANSGTEASVVAIHIDHGLHAYSGQWEQHCREFAADLGVEFESRAVTVAEKPENGPEAAARRARYDAFLSLVRSDDCLLSAHHEDDQAETLMLNLMRGSGPAGLAGIGLRQSFGRGHLLRPMLGVSGEAILEYAERHGLSWIDDPSNTDSRFDRNFIRNEIVPKLAARWPAVSNRLRRSAELVGESSELLNDLADIDLDGLGTPQKLSIKGLQKLSAPRQRNVLRRAVRLCGLPPPPATRLYQVIHELLPARADGQPLVVWAGAEIRRYRDALFVMPTHQIVGGEDTGILKPGGPSVCLGSGLGSLELIEGPGEGIDPKLAQHGLAIRYRGGGESIRISGQGPTRKLKKLLQEEGVVPWMRTGLPLLFVADRLVAVADLWVEADCVANPGLMVNWIDRPALK
jgi:tRNA(Ile)-lysidine synthase